MKNAHYVMEAGGQSKAILEMGGLHLDDFIDFAQMNFDYVLDIKYRYPQLEESIGVSEADLSVKYDGKLRNYWLTYIRPRSSLQNIAQ